MYAKKFLAGFFLRIICLACLPAFVAACSMGGKGAPTPTPVPQVVSKERIIFTVERGSIINQRIIAGEIVPAQQDELFFRTPGYIGNAYVKTGDMVKKGDVLGELQMDDLLDQLEQARIDLEVSQNTLAIEQLQKAYDIQKAESEVVIAQKEVDQAARQVVKTIGAQKEEAQLNLEIAQERLPKLSAR